MVRVLIADRVPLYKRAVVRVIEEHPDQEVVGKTADGYEAIELIGGTEPDVAIVEVALRRLSGLYVLKAIARDHPSTNVLFVSETVSPVVVAAAMAGGASGYLTKDTGAEQLREAVLTVAAGGMVLPLGSLAALLEGLRDRADAHEARVDDETRLILTLTAAGCTAREVGSRLHLAPSTVKMRLRMISHALGVSSAAAATVEALHRHLIEYRAIEDARTRSRRP